MVHRLNIVAWTAELGWKEIILVSAPLPKPPCFDRILEGIGSRDEYVCIAFKIESVFYVHGPLLLKFVCCLDEEKINIKIFLASMKTLSTLSLVDFLQCPLFGCRKNPRKCTFPRRLPV